MGPSGEGVGAGGGDTFFSLLCCGLRALGAAWHEGSHGVSTYTQRYSVGTDRPHGKYKTPRLITAVLSTGVLRRRVFEQVLFGLLSGSLSPSHRRTRGHGARWRRRSSLDAGGVVIFIKYSNYLNSIQRYLM